MRFRVIALILSVLAIALPVYAQDDPCSPQAVIASFAQAADIGEWAAQYSACSPQTQLAVRQLATGYQLLSSEYLPFAAADDPNLFSSIWKWYQGSSSSRLYFLDVENNILSLIADSTMVQRDAVTTAPLLAYPTSGDLTVQVKLDFDPLDEQSGAGIGIRDAQNPNQWIRIAREDESIVISATQDGTTTELASVSYEAGETVVYLRITRVGSLFTLSYSVNNTEWRDAVVNASLSLPAEVEVFLTAYSPGDLVTMAQFAEMRIE